MPEQMAAECGVSEAITDTPFPNPQWSDLERRADEWACKRKNPFGGPAVADDPLARKLLAAYWMEGYLASKADIARGESDSLRREIKGLKEEISRRSAEHRVP